jgi:cytosine/adenosine deaminase-related metal-dependent hydrolase
MRGIAGSWLITGDALQPPIARGALVLDTNERIVAVGEASVLKQRYSAARWQEQHAVLLPGLVNAHTHLELSALCGRVQAGRGFGPWVASLVEQRDQLAPDAIEEGIETAVAELLAFGTAAVGEVTNTLAAVGALGRAALLGRIFHEVYGMRRDVGEAMLGMAEQRRAEIAAWPDNLSYAPAPHTPYTVHPEILCELVRRARALGARTSLHLCEHAAERAYLRDGSGPFGDFLRARGSSAVDWSPPGLDPIRYASAHGLLGPDVLCVHLADARPDEIALLAAAKAPVVLCPRSNLHIEVKLPPLLELLNAGIRPALGTDSLASCSSLDLLEEARVLLERFPSVAPRTLIAMATSYGAQALGLGDRIGMLAEGLAPGVLAFDHDEAAPADPERFVLSRSQRRRRVLARPGTRTIGRQEAA